MVHGLSMIQSTVPRQQSHTFTLHAQTRNCLEWEDANSPKFRQSETVAENPSSQVAQEANFIYTSPCHQVTARWQRELWLPTCGV
jgi:hypothetical protein